MVSIALRWLSFLGLLALAPIAAYWIGRGAPIVVLAVACVLLVVGSLFLMFSRSPPPRAAG